MHPARLVLLELQAPLELRGPQVRVRRGQQGPQARLELRGPQGLLELLVQPVQRVRQERQVRQVRVLRLQVHQE